MKDDLNKEKRRQKALERLGTNTPRCVHCGESDYRCLEAHHIAGRAYDEETVVTCRNCHRKLSDSQKDHPNTPAGEDPSLLDQIGHFLLGLADLFEMLMQKLREFGRLLIEGASLCPPPYGRGLAGEGGVA